MTALTLNLSSLVDKISDSKLEALSRDNPDARLETDCNGNLIFMPPTGSETGDRNLELAFQVKLWNRRSQLGKVFDSSTGFRLSNNAVRSPDVSWVSIHKWNSLSKEQKRKFGTYRSRFCSRTYEPD